MIRLVLSVALLAGCAGCSGSSAIDGELVCSVTQSRAYSPPPEGGAAWDWPVAARAEIDRTDWTEAEASLIRSCGQGTQPPVSRLAFSADRKLALITRSSFQSDPPEAIPGMEPPLELGGAIESCLLRLETVLTSQVWQPVACKLDAVS